MTVEEKANKYAEEAIEASYSDSELMQDFVQKLKKYAKVDYLAGYNEAQNNPDIKPLEWEVHGSIHYVNQYNPIGYTAGVMEWELGKKQYSVRLGLNDGNNSIKTFNSIDEAKDFVQQDFEARIKECLITE